MQHPLYTIGHSTRATAEFVAMLRRVDVDFLVDVRSVPWSRANPQYNADVLPKALSRHRIGYRHIGALGGRRYRSRGAAPSPNTYWQNGSLRAYADYAATKAFRAALDELCDLAEEHRCVIMCAEALWWRCHRRIIADYLLERGVEVVHILGLDHLEPAAPTPGVRRLAPGVLVYRQ